MNSPRVFCSFIPSSSTWLVPAFLPFALVLACSASPGTSDESVSLDDHEAIQKDGDRPPALGTSTGGAILATGGSSSDASGSGGSTTGGATAHPPGSGGWGSSASLPTDRELGEAMTVSGFIVDEEGAPIDNALVSRTFDPFVFVKTDASGAYTLEVFEGDLLSVGALGYQSQRDIELPPVGANIALEPDALLERDELHISFDHLRPGPDYSKDELKRDLGTSSGAGFWDGSVGSNRASVDPSQSVDPGGRSLLVRFPKGQLKTAESGVDTRIPLSGAYKDLSYQADELYLSYWIKLSSNFQLDKCGGKLPSLGGSLAGTDDERWKGRIMWRRGGSIQFYPELPHDNDGFDNNDDRFWGELVEGGTSDICEFEYTPLLSAGVWHQIELHYKLDSGGAGGLFEGWVDGDVVHESLASDVFGYYRPTGGGLDSLTINQLLLSAFLGGSSAAYEPSEDTFAWFDEFRVSKTRIH